jgi:hypothetical protein
MAIPLRRALKLSTVPFVALVATYGLALVLNYPIGLLESKIFRALLWLFEPAVMARRILSEGQETYVYLLAIGPIDILGLSIFYFLVSLFLAACWSWTESLIRRRA